MGFKTTILTVAMILIASTASAKTSCEPLMKDLRAMQQAQASLLKSLSQKNESMAKTLDQFSKSFEGLALQKKYLRRADIVGLKISAKAFREHGNREEQLIKRFEDAAGELFNQVESCLAAPAAKSAVAQAKN